VKLQCVTWSNLHVVPRSYSAQVRDVNDLGMIIANVDGVGSSESTKRGSVASILAIHGSDSVRLAAYGFQMTPESLFHFGNIVCLTLTCPALFRPLKVLVSCIFFDRQGPSSLEPRTSSF